MHMPRIPICIPSFNKYIDHIMVELLESMSFWLEHVAPTCHAISQLEVLRFGTTCHPSQRHVAPPYRSPIGHDSVCAQDIQCSRNGGARPAARQEPREEPTALHSSVCQSVLSVNRNCAPYRPSNCIKTPRSRPLTVTGACHVRVGI